MDKVVHFEMPFDDESRAKNFYSSIFGWDLTDAPMPGGMKYVHAVTTPADPATHMPTEPGSINGGLMPRSDMAKAPIIAMEVSSVDEYIKKIEGMGGKVVMPKTEIGGMGYYAYVTDTENNVIGLWENMKK